MLFSIGPGYFMTWIGIGVFYDHATLGPGVRAYRLSPGARIVYDKCLIRRLIGLPYEDAIRNAESLIRPAAFPGNQTVLLVNNVTLLTSEPEPRVLDRATLLVDYAGSVAPDTSMASQGLFFGGYDVWIHGPSYFINEYFVNATCLATRPSSECVALLLNDIELEKARKEAAKQAAADSGSGGEDNTATIVVAVVVPVGSVLLAALVGSIWWARRNRRRELEQRQRVKAAADKAADLEAGDPREKTGSGGGRLGVLAGGLRRSGDGDVFLGVEGEHGLPQWSEAAHLEADDVGDKSQHTPLTKPAACSRQRISDNASSTTDTEAGACSGNSSADLQPTPHLQPPPAVLSAGLEGRQDGEEGLAQAGQQEHPSGKEGHTQMYTGGHSSSLDPSQDTRMSALRMKPIFTRTLDAAPYFMSGAAAVGQSIKALTAFSGTDLQGSTVNVKPPPDHVSSPEEVVAELGAMVKELRSNANHVAIVLEGVLGHGSFGTVYKGTWQGLPVAIKTVVFSANQESRRHALKEAALCQSIGHPNVIATYATELQPIGVLPSRDKSSDRVSPSDDPSSSQKTSHLNITDWRLYIIQEFADGGPLANLYGHRALWLSPGVVNLAAVVPLALGIARALAHLHSKRIVHGDLNPNNVLLKQDPAQPSGYGVKVGDFGLSVLLPHDRTHLSNIVMGTMFYICPEVACKGHVGPPADVFSLGVILWELYHGRRAGIRTQEGPRYCSNFPSFPPGCPEEYRRITLHCMQRRPQDRPDAVTIVSTLQRLLDNLGAA
ncbi:hypothetical protein CHLRE_07g339850v5 [Chlamydomonas reinhardtii]|uniref:Protein kinase domain-containing protein n=1 Tax=Chlamydomonas reinhardtii TaxID=3055 RepID=A0A2K3DKI7_CHLRE|nr:uncharacterized protein CHLRE_07g339850v5 [Chlamydomonas reinhardtii]PNW81031.1 hypothetical protein CHLRE_07g339850v5 [Chlamydomonas reinhardtii]